MSTLDDLRVSPETEIGQEIVRLVPHWYEAECGPEKYSIPVGEQSISFHNHCRLTPNLATFLARVTARTRELALVHFIRLPSLVDVLLESFAIEWLRIHSDGTDWTKLINYLESVARRTSENQPVALNLIVKKGVGRGDITHVSYQKFFDRLASSSWVPFEETIRT